mmetsp:Transcript_14758/g.29097  ORF Transcript_14758/g.29097 Transcript_14758/m.29097 type:complete len:220 (+) Transcript_14758:76-735(+)
MFHFTMLQHGSEPTARAVARHSLAATALVLLPSPSGSDIRSPGPVVACALGQKAAEAAQHHSHILQVLAPLDGASTHGHLTLPNPLAWIIAALVRLVGSIRVANLALEVATLLLVKFQEAFPIGPLGVCVHIHFHHPIANSRVNVRLLRTRATMENKKEWLCEANLFLEVLLEGIQELWLQFHIAGLVDTMHIPKSSSDCELFRDGRKRIPHELRVLWC